MGRIVVEIEAEGRTIYGIFCNTSDTMFPQVFYNEEVANWFIHLWNKDRTITNDLKGGFVEYHDLVAWLYEHHLQEE